MTVLRLMGLWALGCLLSCQTPPPARPALPHVVLILADDLGSGDIRALNPESGIPTPHLDRLAAEGLTCTDAHSGSAVCTPTRYGLLTGRYAFRTRLKSGVLFGYDTTLLDPAYPTLGQLLQGAGYHTAAVGKWHLGLNWAPQDPARPLYTGSTWQPDSVNVDFAAPVGGSPADFGFDYSYVLPASLDIPPYCMVENGRVAALPTGYTAGIDSPRGVFWRPGPMPPGWAMEQVLPVLTDTAISYMQRRVQRAPDQPFFLYLPLTAPHTPWVPLDSLRGRSEAGRYGDFVAQVDASVGKVLDALDRLGIAGHTLVLFSSDNGAHWTPADQAQYAHRANGPYAGMKADLLEGGHRVPFLVRWPEQVRAGQRSAALLCLTDVFATLAALSGQPLPAGSAEDSYSFMPLLRGEPLPPRPPVVHHSVRGRFALRAGDWKYYPLPGSGGWTEPVGPRQAVAGDPAEAQLYHLPSDPRESDNRLAAEPALADSLARLLAPYRALGGGQE